MSDVFDPNDLADLSAMELDKLIFAVSKLRPMHKIEDLGISSSDDYKQLLLKGMTKRKDTIMRVTELTPAAIEQLACDAGWNRDWAKCYKAVATTGQFTPEQMMAAASLIAAANEEQHLGK